MKRDIRRVEESVKDVGSKMDSQFVTFKDLAPVKQTADRAYNAIVFVVTTVMGILIAGIIGYFVVFNR